MTLFLRTWLALALFIVPPYVQTQDQPLERFDLAIEALRQSVYKLAEPVVETGSVEPLKDRIIAPRSVRAEATLYLETRPGRRGFFLSRQKDRYQVQLTIEIEYDVVTGRKRVEEAKKILLGPGKEK